MCFNAVSYWLRLKTYWNILSISIQARVSASSLNKILTGTAKAVNTEVVKAMFVERAAAVSNLHLENIMYTGCLVILCLLLWLRPSHRWRNITVGVIVWMKTSMESRWNINCTTVAPQIFFCTINRIFNPKMDILSSFFHPHVVPILCDFFFFYVEHKRRGVVLELIDIHIKNKNIKTIWKQDIKTNDIHTLTLVQNRVVVKTC